MTDLAATELYSMLPESYDAKLLGFYMSGYRLFGESNIALSLQMSDTAYADGLIDASKRFDIDILP